MPEPGARPVALSTELRDLVDRAESARDEADPEQFLLAAGEMHLGLCRLAGNRWLSGPTQQLLLHNLRFWRHYFRAERPAPTDPGFPAHMVGGQTGHVTPGHPRPTTAGGQVESGTRLLLVEDDPDLRAMLSRLLDEEGYAVTPAGDGQSALTQFRW